MLHGATGTIGSYQCQTAAVIAIVTTETGIVFVNDIGECLDYKALENLVCSRRKCFYVFSPILSHFEKSTICMEVLKIFFFLGPGSTVHLKTRAETDLAGNDRVLAIADYDVDTSRPSTPGNLNYY